MNQIDFFFDVICREAHIFVFAASECAFSIFLKLALCSYVCFFKLFGCYFSAAIIGFPSRRSIRASFMDGFLPPSK
jgi:hypothetical protein